MSLQGIMLTAINLGFVEEITMKNIRMIAADLDGTLARPDGVISYNTKKVVREAAKLGITIVIATGRPAYGVKG